jgi:hypothetical protein
MTSMPLIEQLLLAGPTCRGPAQCKHSPWTIKGRVHSLEKKAQTHKLRLLSIQAHTANTNTEVDVGCYAPAAQTTLNLAPFLCSSAYRSSAHKSPPNPSLTRIRRVLSATRLENSSDIWCTR